LPTRTTSCTSTFGTAPNRTSDACMPLSSTNVCGCGSSTFFGVPGAGGCSCPLTVDAAVHSNRASAALRMIVFLIDVTSAGSASFDAQHRTIRRSQVLACGPHDQLRRRLPQLRFNAIDLLRIRLEQCERREQFRAAESVLDHRVEPRAHLHEC